MFPKLTIALALCAIICLAHAADLRDRSGRDAGRDGRRQDGDRQQDGGRRNQQEGGRQSGVAGQRQDGKGPISRNRRDVDDERRVGNQGRSDVRGDRGVLGGIGEDRRGNQQQGGNQGLNRDENKGLNLGGNQGQRRDGNLEQARGGNQGQGRGGSQELNRGNKGIGLGAFQGVLGGITNAESSLGGARVGQQSGQNQGENRGNDGRQQNQRGGNQGGSGERGQRDSGAQGGSIRGANPSGGIPYQRNAGQVGVSRGGQGGQSVADKRQG